MKLFERPNSPFWWYEFTINGKRERESTKRLISDRESAERFMVEQYVKAMDRKQFKTKPDTTLNEAFTLASRHLQENTRKLYECVQRKWTGTGDFAKRDLWSLSADFILSDLEQYHLDEHRLERQEEGMKPNSINTEVSILRAVINANKSRYTIPTDLDFKKLKGFVKSRYLSDDEIRQVYEALSVQSPAYLKARDLFVFLIETGTRIGEALNARWADIDLNSGQFEVYRIKTKSLSVVPLMPRTIEVLKRHHNQPQPFNDMTRAVSLLRKAIHEVCDTNPKVIQQRGSATIHSLRDTYASRLVQSGMNLHELSKLLGHTSVAMSSKYGHLEHTAVMDKARKVASVW